MTGKLQSYAAALVEALHDALAADPRVSIVGGYVLGLGPQRALTDRLKKDFPERVIDPPTSEAGIAAVGAGAAMAGMHPFVDLGTASFSYLAWTQLVNEAAVAHYQSGGRVTVPVTYHMLHGVRGGGAPAAQPEPPGDAAQCSGAANRCTLDRSRCLRTDPHGTGRFQPHRHGESRQAAGHSKGPRRPTRRRSRLGAPTSSAAAAT